MDKFHKYSIVYISALISLLGCIIISPDMSFFASIFIISLLIINEIINIVRYSMYQKEERYTHLNRWGN